MLISGWQIADSINTQQKEVRTQARELFVKVSSELQGFDRQCKPIPDHIVNQAESLMLDVVRSDALSPWIKSSVYRMSARIRGKLPRVGRGLAPLHTPDTPRPTGVLRRHAAPTGHRHGHELLGGAAAPARTI